MSSNNLENLLKEMSDAITKLEANKSNNYVIIPDEEIRKGIAEGRLKVFMGDVTYKTNFDSIKIYNKIEDVPKNEQ